MIPNPTKVAARYLTATRPIPIDKREIGHFVQHTLVPQVETWLKRHPRKDDPIGSAHHLASGTLSVESADSRTTADVTVVVHAKPSNAKGAAVLTGGYTHQDQTITLYVNGALSPNDFIDPTSVNIARGMSYKPDRLQPLWECSHETCLAYGLYSILIHEVTHNAESLFTKKLTYSPKEVQEKGEEAWGAYVNDPGEVRAFMQNIVDETERMAGKLHQHFSTNQKLVDTLLKLSTTWKAIETHLTPTARKLILKAVYDMLDRKGLLKS